MENENVIVKQKSNKGVIILLVIIIIILLGISGYLAYDKFISKDTKTNEVTETQKNDSNKITNEERANIKNFLNDNVDYLKTYYEDVSKMDMGKVLMYNFKLCQYDSKKNGSSDYYLKIINKKYSMNSNMFEGDIYLCSKNKVDENFKTITGNDISILPSELLPMYSEIDNAYFFNVSDAFINNIDIISINNIDDKYIVKYKGEDVELFKSDGSENENHSEIKEVTLKKDINSNLYNIISNIPVKE